MKFRRPTVENKGWTWWLGCALSLCLLLGAIAYWASIWLAPAVRIAPAGTLSDQTGPLNLGQAQGLFGLIPVAAPQVIAVASSNIKVVGILAAGQKGSAILAIDGKPGKVYMLGDKVDAQLKLISVDVRQVTLGQDGSTTRQTLAAPPKPEIGILTQGPSKTAAIGGPTSGTSAFQIPGSAPTPMSPITPPPPAMISPPPIINPGSSGNVVTGLPPQGTNPSVSTNPGVSMPAPNFAPPGGANPGPQPTQ
jgi:general secretion pathway protein C